MHKKRIWSTKLNLDEDGLNQPCLHDL